MSKQSKRRREAATRQDRPIICAPEELGRSFSLRLFGLLCRALVVFFAASGMATLLMSALFRSVSVGQTAWIVLLTVLATAILSLHPLSLGLGGIAALGFVIFRTVTDVYGPGGTLYRMIIAGYNGMMVRLYERGIYAAANWRIPMPTGGDSAVFLEHFCLLLTIIIALVFTACLIRRARVLVPALMLVVGLVPVFVFNFSVNNYSVLLLVSGVSGVILLWSHDRRYRLSAAKEQQEVILFPDRRPPMPAPLEQSAAQRRALRKQRKQQKKETLYPTVEQELDEFFGGRRTKKKQKQKAVRSSEEEEERRRVKEYRAQKAAVRRYDRVTAQARSAIGGFSGAMLCLLSALILWLPAATVSRSFHTIDSIDRHVKVYRDYVTALLRGDEDAVEMYEYLEYIKEQQPHSTAAEILEFKEIALMQLRAQHNNHIYMADFVGVDYEEGAWQYFSDGQYLAYRELYDAHDMPAEEMFADFMALMDQESEDKVVDFVTRYKNRKELGFMVGMLNVKRYNRITTEAYFPRVLATNYGILEYFSNTSSEMDFANAFDGLCVSSGFDIPNAAYSVIAYSPTHEDEDAYLNRAALIAQYNKKYKYSKSYKEAQSYADFVYSTYLDATDSTIVADYLNGILARLQEKEIDVSGAQDRNSTDAATYEKRHLLTMAIIDELVLNHTYTRTPMLPLDESLDGVENFLSVTREGYCVQFASAAALMLRQCGIPARFVEGYLAADFELDIYAQDGGRYQTIVRDSDAHAWIEVWYDGIGWIVYECTPTYYINMYGDSSETADKLKGDAPGQTPEQPEDPPVIVPPVDIPPVDIPEDPMDPGEDELNPPTDLPTQDGGVDIKAILRLATIIVGGAAVLTLVVWLVLRFILRAKRAAEQRCKLAEDIIAGSADIFAGEADRAEAARALVRQTMALLAMYGTPPQPGEWKDDYAKRLSFAYEKVLGYPAEYGEEEAPGMTREHVSAFKIGELMDAMSAEEFGHGMRAEEMKKLAHFYLKLRAEDRKFVRPGKRFVLHYVKREL